MTDTSPPDTSTTADPGTGIARILRGTRDRTSTPTRLGRLFATIAIVEAVTWTGLLVGMFLKYVTATTEMGVNVFGRLHGAAFVLYVIVTAVCAVRAPLGVEARAPRVRRRHPAAGDAAARGRAASPRTPERARRRRGLTAPPHHGIRYPCSAPAGG